MNFFKTLWFPWKPMDCQLGTISENARIGDCYQCTKFYACIKKCTVSLKFRVMPPDYTGVVAALSYPLLDLRSH